MHRGAAFGDILAEKLRDVYVDWPSPRAGRPGFGPASSSSILDGEARVHFRATPYGRIAGATECRTVRSPCAPQHAPSPLVAPGAAAPRPPRRILSPRHQRALDALIGFGADLHPDFTEAELRSAFRSLARCYHPDRHPGTDAAESGRLARIFSGLAGHYRELLAVTHTPIAVN
jgi:hypothetical protein